MQPKHAVRFEENQPEIVRLASRLSKLGFTVTDSVAVQHYLQPGFHGLHNDLDVVVHGAPSDLPALNRKLKGVLPPFEQVKKFSAKRQSVYSTHTPSGLRVDLEITNVPFSSIPANLEHSVSSVKERLAVRVPDVNFLVARLMRSVSIPSLGWTRRLDYLTYLSSIVSGNSRKKQFSKSKVRQYLRKMCGGEAERTRSLARFSQVLSMTDVSEMLGRTHKFDADALREANLQAGLQELGKTFSSSGPARHPLILLSHAIHSLPVESRRQLGAHLRVGQSDQELMSAVLRGVPAEEKHLFLESLGENPAKFVRKLVKKSKAAAPKERASVEPRVFLISDTHFDHEKIIGYCRRPFRDVQQMNEQMARRWNKTVRPQDEVYFVGDLALGKNARRISKWLKRLNGNITIIRGDHDNPESGVPLLESKKISRGGIEFLLVHDPEHANASHNWRGWTIHGHHHNNDLEKYPLIHPENRTVNVSAELLNYTPLDIDQLVEKIKESRKK